MAVIRIMLVLSSLLATEMSRIPPLLANQWNIKSAHLLLNVSSQFRWLVLCHYQSCYCVVVTSLVTAISTALDFE